MDTGSGHVFHNVTVGDLGQIRRYVYETAVSRGCGLAETDELIVAVNEALANIVRHGYPNGPGEIKVAVVCGEESVKVIIIDKAPPFDPTTVPSPDTTLPLEKRPLGGMGIHMMRAFSDELSYRRDPLGGNELTLLKRYKP